MGGQAVWSDAAVNYDYHRKIIITGLGASGTTYTATLLHHLGFETGFSDKYINEHPKMREMGKGMEWLIGKQLERFHEERHEGVDSSPQVIKQPYSVRFGSIIRAAQAYGWRIDALIICIREKNAFLERHYKWSEDMSNESQALTMATVGRRLYQMLHDASTIEIDNVIMLEFPRSVRDPEYTARQLSRLGVTQSAVETAMKITARPEMIHA